MEIKVRPSARIGDYERGVTAERERIIKLIKQQICPSFYEGLDSPGCHDQACYALNELLGIIRFGENK